MSNSKNIRILAKALARQNTHLLEEQKRRELYAMALQDEKNEQDHHRLSRAIDLLSQHMPTILSLLSRSSGASRAACASPEEHTGDDAASPLGSPGHTTADDMAASVMALLTNELFDSFDASQFERLAATISTRQLALIVKLGDCARMYKAATETARANGAQDDGSRARDQSTSSSCAASTEPPAIAAERSRGVCGVCPRRRDPL